MSGVLNSTERKAVEVIATGEWPDSPNHGTFRAECMVQWLKDAGIVLMTEKQVDAIHSDGFRQGLGPEPFA
jgi:hypothetical protein